jgi:hypothetical protein
MQVLSLRHSRPAKSGYDESCGITPYASRKAQKMPKQGKTKGEVKPNARSKTKARGTKALSSEAKAALAEADHEAAVGSAMDHADPLETSCTFRIVVVAEDRSTTTYVLHIHLEPPQAHTLAWLGWGQGWVADPHRHPHHPTFAHSPLSLHPPPSPHPQPPPSPSPSTSR